MPRRHLLPILAAVAAAALTVGLVGLDLDSDTIRDRGGERRAAVATDDGISAKVVGLRRETPKRSVQAAVSNEGPGEVQVTRLRLLPVGFDPAAAFPQDAPIRPGLVVNLPIRYGEPRCQDDVPPSGPEEVAAQVVLTVSSGSGVREVHLTAMDELGVLRKIWETECRAQALRREVTLSFGPRWQRVGSGADIRMLTTLEVRLLDPSQTFEVTQTGGSVIYGISPRPGSPVPLGRVDRGAPRASIPVQVTQTRCDAHARSEVKRPYAFNVWLSRSGGPELATMLPTSPADRARLATVCQL